MAIWEKTYCNTCGHLPTFHKEGICTWPQCECTKLMIPLSKREYQIFLLLASGLSCKDIVTKLVEEENTILSLKTIECHMNNLMRKLDVSHRIQLTFIALQTGKLKLEDLPNYHVGIMLGGKYASRLESLKGTVT